VPKVWDFLHSVKTTLDANVLRDKRLRPASRTAIYEIPMITQVVGYNQYSIFRGRYCGFSRPRIEPCRIRRHTRDDACCGKCHTERSGGHIKDPITVNFRSSGAFDQDL
jgi:hypothetical protein